MTNRLLHSSGTMPELARRNGQEPCMIPPTVCPAIARFINAAEIPLNSPQRQSLWELIPHLENSRHPELTHRRLTFLASLALREHATDALRRTGHLTGAAMLRDEPDDTVCASLARALSARLYRALPSHPTTTRQHDAVLTSRCIEAATKAAQALANPDPYTNLTAAERAAEALSAWCSLSGTGHTEHTRHTVMTALHLPER